MWILNEDKIIIIYIYDFYTYKKWPNKQIYA